MPRSFGTCVQDKAEIDRDTETFLSEFHRLQLSISLKRDLSRRVRSEDLKLRQLHSDNNCRAGDIGGRCITVRLSLRLLQNGVPIISYSAPFCVLSLRYGRFS